MMPWWVLYERVVEVWYVLDSLIVVFAVLFSVLFAGIVVSFAGTVVAFVVNEREGRR